MKFLVLYFGELSNVVYYFFLFGDVNDDNKYIINGFFGFKFENIWYLWVYLERLEVVVVVNELKEKFFKIFFVESIKRIKVFNFIKGKNLR